MKSLIRWAISNTPAMNTAVIAVMLVGGAALYQMHREFFPEFELEIIFVSVPYPGASPEEVEESICQRVEEAVQPLQDIKRLTSIAAEGVGTVILELEADVDDVQKVLNEVRSEVDRLPSFPPLRAEEPEIKQITLRQPAIKVAVVGPDQQGPEAELKLRTVAEQVRNEVLLLPAISQADIGAAKDFQIDVEMSENTLRKYSLSLQSVADAIRRENVEVPAGVMRTESQELLLRGKNKGLVGEEIAKIPLVTRKDGVVLTVGDLGLVRDQFVDTTSSTFVNGKPGMVVQISKTADEDLLAIVAAVKDFVARTQQPEGADGYDVPEGYRLVVFGDSSVLVRDRLELLRRNGLQGLILVFVVLAAFLELRLAFWVALGIPVSILGGCGILFAAGETLNMLSMFAFLMALGILVDDAIVIGENVYSHRQQGKGYLAAAVDGAYEVLPSVLASVSTAIIAFMPLLFVPGIMGKFIAVIPLAVIVMLLISLLESTFVLPCHLAHSGEHDAEKRARRLRRAASGRTRVRLWTIVGAVWCAFFLAASLVVLLAEERVGSFPAMLQKVPQVAEHSSMLVIALFVLALLPYVWSSLGLFGRWFRNLFAWLNDWVAKRLEWIIARVYTPVLRFSLDCPWIVLSLAAAIAIVSSGVYLGGIVPFTAFAKMDVPLILATVVYPDGTPESITDKATRRVEQAILRINEQYAAEGQPVVQTVVRSVGDANTLGTLAPTQPPVGSHAGGVAVELVDVQYRPNTTSMELVRRWREEAGEFPGAEEVTFAGAEMGPGGAAIEFKFLATPQHMAALEKAAEEAKEKLSTYPGVYDITDDSRAGKWEFHVRVKKTAEAMGVTNIIMAIIPFGAIGAVFGHVIMGFNLTLMSLFGLVALTGVVVNDSIVLIDFINHRLRDGVPVKEALLDAGRQRFRPVMLTSITTVVGLLPLLLEPSFQARVLQPMAASLAFGLMFATLLVLVLVPAFYLVYTRMLGTRPPAGQ